MTPETSIGVGGTYDAGSGHVFATADVKLRVYPFSSSLSGTSVVLTAGYARARNPVFCVFDCSKRYDDGPAVGLGLDHNYIVGESRRFVLGSGIGVKRLFGAHRDTRNQFIPTIRLLAGWSY